MNSKKKTKTSYDALQKVYIISKLKLIKEKPRFMINCDKKMR